VQGLAALIANLFDAVDLLSYRYPSGAANFCACLLKPLERSYGYAHARFSQTFIKNSLAQNPWGN